MNLVRLNWLMACLCTFFIQKCINHSSQNALTTLLFGFCSLICQWIQLERVILVPCKSSHTLFFVGSLGTCLGFALVAKKNWVGSLSPIPLDKPKNMSQIQTSIIIHSHITMRFVLLHQCSMHAPLHVYKRSSVGKLETH